MEDSMRLQSYKNLYPSLKENPKFLLDYGQFLFSIGDSNSIWVLEYSKRLFINSAVLQTLTSVYKEKKDYRNATINARQLADFIPYKYQYKKQLLDLYHNTQDTINVKTISEFIVAMPIKKPSKEVDLIKEEAKRNL